MSSLTLVDVTVSHGAEAVFEYASLSVGDRSRIGVVGPNGAGKTTLLRLLAGLERPETGAVRRSPPGLRAGYLPQELDALRGETLLAYLTRRTGIAAAETELEGLAARLRGEPGLVDAYSDALERFLALGGDDLEARAGAVCAGLGLEGRLDQPLESLSGGQAARARLAALLLARFDVCCLDEPTNDLDFEGLDRLERFVREARGSIVVVSHDRAFLDRTVTRIMELEEGTRRLREWPGGWSEYESARERARAARYRRFEDAEARRREAQALLRESRGQARGGEALGKRTGGADRRGTQALSSKVRQADARSSGWKRWRNPSSLPVQSGLRSVEARTLLAKFGLGAEDVLRSAHTLSPGERTRAALALMMARGVSCLALDEPTNHLDLPAIEELEVALEAFQGTIVLVTHDRRLLERFGPTRQLELKSK
jgi:ATPase subunit of ABC transporter with duplicated ATPase domains